MTLEERKIEIIDNLTDEQEEELQTIHAEQADGVLDDDLSDDYERWLENLTVMDLEKYLEL